MKRILHHVLDRYSWLFSWQQRVYSRNYIDLVRVFKPLLPAPGARILDIGCGTADCAMILLDGAHTHRYTGTDMNVQYIEKNRRRFPQSRFITAANLSSHHFAGDSADCCLLFCILHHLNDREIESLLADVRRILVPGGTVLVTEPMFWPEARPGIKRRISNFLLGLDRGRYIRDQAGYQRFFAGFKLDSEFHYTYSLHNYWGARYIVDKPEMQGGGPVSG
jgi:ubiquinone/menaquinone biosynthesis C-methylase UbiE